MMDYCKTCKVRVRVESHDNKTWCTYCGSCLAEDFLTEEVGFVKTADGQSRFAGNFSFIREGNSESRERTIYQAYDEIYYMMSALDIHGGEDKANEALRIYKLALEKNFTKGRRRELRACASCLSLYYVMNKKSFLLIDFSEHLRINVGCLFAALQTLKPSRNPTILNLLDPSLFIHRFANRLFGDKNPSVSKTALHIVASMKRDWMQTGRKPSGLCGAALYISALAHGLNCSKSEIIRAVHVCEATLTKRLIEFENTESGGLTIEEFENKSKEFEDQAEMFGKDKSQSKWLNTGEKELLCMHKGSETPQFAYGLCNECYKEFMILSGGLNDGSEPPAFQRAERKRKIDEEAASDISQNLDSSTLPGLTHATTNCYNSDEQRSIKNTIVNDGINERMDDGDFTRDESESLSDIDDPEVDEFILDEKEKIYKKAVWEELNREHLKEQAEKEAAKKAKEAMFSNCSDDVAGARKLRKEKRQKRDADYKNLGPFKTAAEAAKQMLVRKGLSSRFRQDIMDEMFGSSEQSNQSPENSRMEPETQHDQEEEEEVEETEYDGNGEGYINYAEEYNYDECGDMDDY